MFLFLIDNIFEEEKKTRDEEKEEKKGDSFVFLSANFALRFFVSMRIEKEREKKTREPEGGRRKKKYNVGYRYI